MLTPRTIHESLILHPGMIFGRLPVKPLWLPLGHSQNSQMGPRQVLRMSGRQTAKLLVTRDTGAAAEQAALSHLWPVDAALE